MSLFNQIPSRLGALVSLLMISLIVSACGYRPLYGQSGPTAQTTQNLAAIEIRPIPDRAGQIIRTALKHSLLRNAQQSPKSYDLTITLKESLSSVAVEQNSFATRGNLSISAHFQLIRKSDGLELLTGSANTISSYNILSSDFATLAAKDNARKHGLEGLAATIHTRLAVYFQGPGAKPPPQLSGNTYR